MPALSLFIKITCAIILLALTTQGAPVTSNPKTIDEILRDASMQATFDDVINLARDPVNIGNFLSDASVNDDSVTWDMDMRFTKEQWEAIKNDPSFWNSGRSKRNAIKGSYYRWPDAVIPYDIVQGAFTTDNLYNIQKAMDYWQAHTCVQFRRSTSEDKDKIKLQTGKGCSSYVGKIGGIQEVTLGRGCRFASVVQHELGHAIGFQHEHTRFDRENHVTIKYENIKEKFKQNFNIFGERDIESFDVPYDYLSIMHYGPRAFTNNGEVTIEVNDKAFEKKIGKSKVISFRDIKLANLMYDCAGNNNCPKLKCPGEGFVDKNCTCQCPQDNPEDPTIECEPITTPTAGLSSLTSPFSSPSTTTTATTTTTTRPSTQIPVTVSPDCQDASSYKKYCPVWARGEGCNTFKDFMEKQCRRTCGFCATTFVCKDIYASSCLVWRRSGFCESDQYKIFMTNNCARTCGKCSSPFSGQSKGKECKNKYPFCRLWARMGQCTMPSTWKRMFRDCPKACDACEKRTANI